MIDVHCHLDLYPNPLEVANESERLGIYTIGVTNLPSHFIQGFTHLKTYKKVRLAIGMHPLYANRHDTEYELFQNYIDQTSYVGEIGLDFSKEGIETKDQQIKSFEFVLNEIKGKPKFLSLHSRGAEEQTLKYLLKYKISTAVFHWYTGPSHLVEEIAKVGFMFSVNTAMTKSKNGREIISRIPLSNILTETDGPFIQLNNRPIKPSDLGLVEASLSELYNKPIGAIQDAIKNNFSRLIKAIS